jgi:NAD(P)H dehydrogenase (quinone)
MFAILGATGKVGLSTISTLRQAGTPVRAIVRDETKAGRFRAMGCEVALADLRNVDALSRAIADADAVQIILPPPFASEDAVGDMRRSIDSLADAFGRAHPARLVAVSDYGAHVGEWIGMPSVFRLFEERLRELAMPKVFLRSAEHMEGWGLIIPVAVATGILPSLHQPLDMQFPTISAPDLGRIAAELLLRRSTGASVRIVHAEGPRRYSANDVAAGLSQLCGRAIVADAQPRSQWRDSLVRVVSPSVAALLIDLYDAHNKGGLVDIEPDASEVRYGTTTLVDALRPLVPSAARYD